MCRAQLVASQNREEGASKPLDTDASWAHLLKGAEPGCVLLANPMLFSESQQYFRQAVILILDHAAEHSTGIILNRLCLRDRLQPAELPGMTFTQVCASALQLCRSSRTGAHQ